MRRSVIATLAAATATLAIVGTARAQVGVEVYVGPPAAYYYGPGYYVANDYEPGAYSYYYAPGITVYRRRGGEPSANNTGAFFRHLDREGRGGNGGN
jgi:hypothetical protein